MHVKESYSCTRPRFYRRRVSKCFVVFETYRYVKTYVAVHFHYTLLYWMITVHWHSRKCALVSRFFKSLSNSPYVGSTLRYLVWIFHHFTLSCFNYVKRISLASLTHATKKSPEKQRPNTNSIMTKTRTLTLEHRYLMWQVGSGCVFRSDALIVFGWSFRNREIGFRRLSRKQATGFTFIECYEILNSRFALEHRVLDCQSVLGGEWGSIWLLIQKQKITYLNHKQI